MEYIYNYKKYFIIGGIILLLCVFIYCFIVNNQENEVFALEETKEPIVNTTKINNTFYVDVKGAVKKPGVYEFQEGDKIIDAINKSGGLKSNATTKNINLSKKLTSEMVIYIFTEKELTTTKNITTKTTTTTTTQVPECICETIEVNNCIDKNENVIENNKSDIPSNNKININTASKDELMKLNGIGESKALAIISYRKKTPFVKIEDIMNVSGLGESIFNKIKENITV